MARPRRRRYELRSPALNAELEALVDRALAEAGRDAAAPGADFVRQLVVSALRLVEDGTDEGDLKLLNAALKELRHALRVFAPYAHVRKVSVFGSARTLPDHPDWRQAHAFAERMVQEGWMVITGAGDGIMSAAQGGAGREASFGVNIRLPFEQRANRVIEGDPKLVNFRYFFTRKLMFVKESHAIVLFPGGFGTHDEGFEALTLIQTGKSEIVPVVFIDAPGGTYWKEWAAWVDSHLCARGLIDPDDRSLFHVTDDVADAVRVVTGFYRNYHSSRYVGERLVLRVRRAPDARQLAAINEKFGELVASGAIRTEAALPEEGDEAADLPRIVLHFDRRSMGRLRRLIDHLNALPGVSEAEPAEASPHRIVPQRPSPEAEAEEERD
jgi:uncharacterized protein (TIGR00730 family)